MQTMAKYTLRHMNFRLNNHDRTRLDALVAEARKQPRKKLSEIREEIARLTDEMIRLEDQDGEDQAVEDGDDQEE